MYDYLSQSRKVLEPKDFRHIHQKCESAVNDLKSCESQLIYALQEADKFKIYRYLGKNSLFQYALSLGLSESQAYNYITVARKSRECPELQKAIDKKEITISKARAVSGVIREDNQIKWIQLAKTSTKRELEKAVAKVSPRALKKESARFINDHTLELQLPVSEEIFKQLERVKDLLAQKHKKHICLEEALGVLAKEFICKHDPVERAKRKMNKIAETKNSNNHADTENKIDINDNCSESNLSIKTAKKIEESKIKCDKNKANTKNNLKIKKHTASTNIFKSKTLPVLGRVIPKSIEFACRHEEKAVLGTAPTKQHPGKPLHYGYKRKKLSTELVNNLNMRDQGQCQFQLENNQICGQSRWVENHHITPVACGGQDQLDNLITLCSEHHKQVHLIKNEIKN